MKLLTTPQRPVKTKRRSRLSKIPFSGRGYEGQTIQGASAKRAEIAAHMMVYLGPPPPSGGTQVMIS
jgi:hypothetical protein